MIFLKKFGVNEAENEFQLLLYIPGKSDYII